MDESAVLGNTVLPLFFYELVDDFRGGTDAPKSKGFWPNDLTKMLPKDRRLQALVLLYEIGTKLELADRQIHEPGQRFVDPYLENAIVQFSAVTGLPEADVRRVINRPRLDDARANNEPGPAPDQIAVFGVVDP